MAKLFSVIRTVVGPLIVLSMAIGCAGWSPQQKALGAVATGLIVLDWHQTQKITRDCQEDNPIIGECGQGVDIDMYFPLAIGLNLLLAHVLPEYRTAYLGVISGMQGAVTWNNYRQD